MAETRRIGFVYGQLAWMSALLILLVLLGSLSLELFFAGSLIGLLFMIEYTSPDFVTPVWRQRVRWVLIVGILVFAFIVIDRTLPDLERYASRL